jgi:hypothetical protein
VVFGDGVRTKVGTCSNYSVLELDIIFIALHQLLHSADHLLVVGGFDLQPLEITTVFF